MDNKEINCGSKTVVNGKCTICGQEVNINPKHYSKKVWEKMKDKYTKVDESKGESMSNNNFDLENVTIGKIMSRVNNLIILANTKGTFKFDDPELTALIEHLLLKQREEFLNIDYEQEIADLLLLWGNGINSIPNERRDDLESFGLQLLLRVHSKFIFKYKKDENRN